MAASRDAGQLIEKITNGVVQKDVLTNTAKDFTGKGEQHLSEQYSAYLRTLAYEETRRIT
jgi:hypothetical protein